MSRPQHTVYLDDRYIARYPIANAQYAVFVRAIGYRIPPYWNNGKIPSGIEDHPVTQVSWDDAMAFCNWLAKSSGRAIRLLSEAEWETAASWDAGQKAKRLYPWRNKADKSKWNWSKSSQSRTTPVGANSSRGGDSPYGVADMAGNVWEWTSSLYRDYPYDPNDGREDMAGHGARVLRGGSEGGERVFRAVDRLYDGLISSIYGHAISFRVGMSSTTVTNPAGSSA